MTNKIYIVKVREDGYGEAVSPEMEQPKEVFPVNDHAAKFDSQMVEIWNNHLASLPFTLVHPSFNCKQGDWISEWAEGWEVQIHPGSNYSLVTLSVYEKNTGLPRRIVLLPKVEEKKEDGVLQVLSFETDPPEWVDCDKYEYNHAEENKRRVVYNLINCLAYALRFWKQEPSMRLYYCSGHVINSHAPINTEGSPKWLPAEDYGFNYFIGSFGDLLDDYEKVLLRKYFN